MPPVRGQMAKPEHDLWFSYCKDTTPIQPWGAPPIMPKVAYTIAEAAVAASTDESTIVEAIRESRLTARIVDSCVIICRTSLEQWVESLPVYQI